jgi:uncharacterized protein DUF5916
VPRLDTTAIARPYLSAVLRSSAATAALVVAVGVPVTASEDADAGGRRRISAVHVTSPIVVDGHLDEPVWRDAPPAEAFVQQQPHEGEPGSGTSDVRFVYDDAVLYVGGTFFDAPDAPPPIVDTLKRDFTSRDGDVVSVVIDTFLDGRNAFTFTTNPGGALSDGQSHDDGRQTNQDWNGVWTVRTGRLPGGWTMEMAIPFRTLRFPQKDVQTWGLNVMRVLRRRNEVTTWSPVPRQFTERKVSFAGVLEGIHGVRAGRSLRVKPALVGAVQTGEGRTDAGLDVKYGWRDLTWDLTLRADYSQVEVDEEQINLTRVSPVLPEKREFFLENQGSFTVGDQTGTNGSRDLLPFFSRRIGLAGNESVPVYAGGRVTGRQGRFGIGGLFVTTGLPGDAGGRQQYVAMRLTREVGRRHRVGAVYLAHASPLGDTRAGGVDAHLGFGSAVTVDAVAVRSAATEGAPGRPWALRGALQADTTHQTTRLAYTNVGAGYRNDVGYVAREDAAVAAWEHEWVFRPRAADGWLHGFTIGGEGELVDDSLHRQAVSRLTRNDYSLEFADGGRAGVDLDWNVEHLVEPFEIARGVTLPPGTYRFANATPGYRSDRSRTLSGTVGITTGHFWSGTISGGEVEGRVRVSAHGSLTGTLERNHVVLAEGTFDTTLAKLRVDWSFSTRAALNALVQYNSARRAWLTNVRFSLMHRPLSDLFVVYTDQRPAAVPATRSLAVKYTHLLSF